MPDGCRSRRMTGSIAWMACVAVLTTAGCQPLPIARLAAPSVLPRTLPEPSPDAVARARRPEPIAPGTDLPPLPESAPAPTPEPAPTLQPKPSVERVSTPASATPLLDMALIRAEALKELSIEVPCDFECDPPAPAAARDKPKADVAEGDRATTRARDEPRPIDPERTPAVVAPQDPWREGLERLRTLARHRSGERTDDWELRTWLLDWIADAQNHPGRASLGRTVLTALVAASGPESAGDQARAERIRAAVQALEDQAPLAIVDLRLCRKVLGFGNFEPLDASGCKAGQALIVYCEMEGLRFESGPRGDVFRSRLSSRLELVPAQGGEPVWSHTLGMEEACRRRRRDYYVNYKIVLPDPLPPGPYELRLTQNDEVAGRITTAAIPLTIQP